MKPDAAAERERILLHRRLVDNRRLLGWEVCPEQREVMCAFYEHATFQRVEGKGEKVNVKALELIANRANEFCVQVAFLTRYADLRQFPPLDELAKAILAYRGDTEAGAIGTTPAPPPASGTEKCAFQYEVGMRQCGGLIGYAIHSPLHDAYHPFTPPSPQTGKGEE